MKWGYSTLVLALVGLGALTVFPVALHAQAGKDCGEGSACSAADYVKALLPEPTAVWTRGVGPRPQEPKKPPMVTLQVQFETGSDVILPRYHTALKELGSALTRPELAPYRFEIQGHTDSVGSERLNQVLSQKRAESVKRYLVKNFAVPQERVTAMGYGPKEPIASNDTAEGRSKNRRVQVVNIGQ